MIDVAILDHEIIEDIPGLWHMQFGADRFPNTPVLDTLRLLQFAGHPFAERLEKVILPDGFSAAEFLLLALAKAADEKVVLLPFDREAVEVKKQQKIDQVIIPKLN